MKFRYLAASAATLALCQIPGHAFAQQVEQPQDLDEQNAGADDNMIVVTAQHRRESAQDVPIALTAITGDSLAKDNVASLQDLAGAVPGVVVSKAVSYGLAPIAIRGLGGPAGGGSPFTDQPVAVYVDGVYVPALAQSVSDFLDVDTLQILRGPQGTLYGRNSTAGAILISSKRPDLEQVGGFVNAGYASYDQFKASGAINLPLVEGSLGLRLAAGYNDGGDWAKNTVDDRRFGGGRSTQLRGSLRWQSDGGATVDLIVDHSDATSHPATVSLATTSLAFRGPALGLVYVGDPYLRRSDFSSVLEDREVQFVGDQTTKTRATDLTLIAEVPLGALTLTSITGFRKFRVTGMQDVSAAPTPPALINSNNPLQKQKSFSQEVRLSSDDAARLRWTLGAYYFHQDTDASLSIISTQGGPPVATGFGPNGPIFAGMPSGTEAEFHAAQKVDSIAFFADATYDLTDTLSLTGGVRYSKDMKDAEVDNRVTTIIDTPIAGPVIAAGSCPSAAVSCEASFENVSPRAVLTFKPTRRNMLYASFAKGFNSGGFNNFGNVVNPTDPTNPLENSSEKITSYEIGSKNELFDRAVTFNVAAFQTDYKDLHIRQAVLTGGVAIVNVPKSRVRGVEVESVIAPVGGLTLALNGSYLDGELSEGTLAALPTDTGVIVVGQNQTVVEQDISGNRLTRAPKWQGSAKLSYAIPTAFALITPSIAWRGQTKTYFLETNQDTDQYIASGWSEVDVRLGIADHGDRWEIAVFGTNIFDNRHISQIVPYTGFPHATLNDPVTWGVTGKFNF